MRPFADGVADYALAGWPAILPVPVVKKSPPPVGFTGDDGRDTDPHQLATWAGSHGDWSIALRMPDGVIGIDVDHYRKGEVDKRGGDWLAEYERRWGPLPATWRSSARDLPSGIRFYRVPAGRYATKLGESIEIIQRHHRYAVVAPSANPDAAGALYCWYDPSGALSDSVPKPNELPDLPEAWVTGLREGASEAGPAAADHARGHALLTQLMADNREPCAEVTDAARKAATELVAAESGSRHDTALARSHHLVQMGAAGHPGTGWALMELRAQWEHLTAGEGREAEFDRMLVDSARKAVTAIGDRQVDRDPCFAVGTVPMAAPAPVDNRPGEPDGAPLEPIEPPKQLHPFEVIGAHEFNPRGHLDQTLADAVLERTQPVLRYAHDARVWLLRGPDVWETRADLAGWAVALLADRMPQGDPEAEKGSEARDQADRRKRFMTSASSRGVAAKMRDRVAGGVHPNALKLGDLDREPWLLWAGGLPFDLRASAEQPTLAWADPSTPHLHSAAVPPTVRPTPLWDAFLAAVWPDPELRAWALRVLSVTVTGYSDKVLPIMVGQKDRGKTQVVALIMSVLGTYAHAADPRLLGGADKAHASIIYALMGRRLSFIDEGPREGRLGQERLKQLTGGGELTGNAMNQNPVTWAPTHTLVLTANDEPILTDPAVRSRVRLIPCEGDPEQVIAARAAIGHPSGRAWRAEAPGVLARLMREAAAWLDNPASALTSAAPEAYRYRAEEIAAEQDPIATWLEEETEPDEYGERSRTLYEAFVSWARVGKPAGWVAPSETKWGRELNDRGYPARHTEAGKRRPLKLRQHGGGWLPIAGPVPSGAATNPSAPTPNPSAPAPNPSAPAPDARPPADGLTPSTDGFLTGSPANPSGADAEVRPTIVANPDGLTGYSPSTATRAHTHTHEGPMGSGGSTRHPVSPPSTAKITKAAAKEAEREAARVAAAGESVPLPVAVDRAGTITPLDPDGAAAEIVAAVARTGGALTVDVEHSGYPVGHRDYVLRTVQLGDEATAVVLDPVAHGELIRQAVAAAPRLHAHSATADLVPLAYARLTDESAWDRMHDTVIPAKLADPSSTGSDPDLKHLAANVLGAGAVAPAADQARAELFKVNKWLTNTEATTPVERSGWAQVDPTCATMERYAASDVLDTAALAVRLPRLPDQLLDRERGVQRITARVAYRGLRIDHDKVRALTAEHEPAMAAAADRMREMGVPDAGSDRQLATRLTDLGVALPRTKPSAKFPEGQPSVAAGVLEGFRKLDGEAGDLVRAVLDYRHAETVLSLFLEPYRMLCESGDGRARPTVYTLGTDTGRMSCVQSDALIEMPRDLSKHPAGVPITEVKAGDWVYAFDHQRELVLRRVKWCQQTGVRQTLIVTAENSAGHQLTLRATPEHLVRLRNGDWRATELLLNTPGKPRRDGGPRLMTMVRRTIDDGYIKFFPHSVARLGAGVQGGGKSREHRWIVEQITGKRVSTKVDVDHIDGNKANNHPSNLRPLPLGEHRGNRSLAWGVEQPDVDLPSGPTDYRVVSVVPGPIEPVWDMEVEDVHNFIANGICVHNCVRPNLQQLPRQGGVRACITADPGHVLISADFSGVEIRVMAALSQDPNLVKILAEGADLHAMVAEQAFGPEWTKADRYTAKRGVFGWAYGGGVPTLARQTGVPESTMAAIVDSLGLVAPAYVAWADEVKRQVRAGATQMPTYSGRVIHLQREYPHKSPNFCIQGTARELLVDALLAWDQTRWGGGVVLPVHDEVVAVVPEQDAQEATAELVRCMTRELYGIEIKAEASEPAFAWRDSA